MSVLIAYATKTGTARSCAVRLANLIPGEDIHICDLSAENPNPANYDTVVVGGSVRVGSLHPAAKRFLNKNAKLLKEKRAAYFICNCFLAQSKDILKKNIPQELWETALCLDSFGGEMDMQKQKGLDKIITRMVAKAPAGENPPQTSILEERIAAFAEALMGSL